MISAEQTMVSEVPLPGTKSSSRTLFDPTEAQLVVHTFLSVIIVLAETLQPKNQTVVTFEAKITAHAAQKWNKLDEFMSPPRRKMWIVRVVPNCCDFSIDNLLKLSAATRIQMRSRYS